MKLFRPPAAPAPTAAIAPEVIRLTQPPVALKVRRSARARRFTLSVSRIDGTPLLTLPAAATLAEGREFALRHAEWLASALARAPAPREVRAGAPLPIAGRMVELASTGAPRGAPRLEDGRLVVSGRPEDAPRRALAYVKDCARKALVPAAHNYAAKLGKAPSSITFRDTRSRWGSCSSDGSLSFSWRLILAPPEVLDYVAAHEAAHLVEMNHAPQFWAVVEGLMPDWRPRRDWLRDNGAGLHRWRF
ncbi:MAG: putative metal-dependent hydrolase [Paracoccaceae bacterium]|jgi:predicted metal-dependent hydrolase